MHFRLVMRGALPPDKRNTLDVKHRIRRELHPQLRAFWLHHPALKGHFEPPDEHEEKLKAMLRKRTPEAVPESPQPSRLEQIANEFKRCDRFRFAPLVRVKAQMACSLELLLLRREEPYRVFGGTGDLDGRVKTLLDGLRMPQQCSEVEGHDPSADEDPFFCLLEDDRLIYDLSVTTDLLLVPPEELEPYRDVVAIINVKITLPGGDPISYLCGDI